MNDMDVTIVRTALSNLVAAVMKVQPDKGGEFLDNDLTFAMAEAQKVLGYPFVPNPSGEPK